MQTEDAGGGKSAHLGVIGLDHLLQRVRPRTLALALELTKAGETGVWAWPGRILAARALALDVVVEGNDGLEIHTASVAKVAVFLFRRHSV